MSVYKTIHAPNKAFDTKLEMFTYLLKHKDDIIADKCTTKTRSEYVSFVSPDLSETTKGIDGLEEGFVYPIINTTKFLDSHNDVHLDDIWKKSVKEQQGKVYYVADHEIKVNSIIARPKDVEMSVREVAWKDIGGDFDGTTQALIFKVKPDRAAPLMALEIIADKEPVENSIRMQYVPDKVKLAVNSDDKEFRAEKKIYDKHIDSIANKEQAIEQGYFWAVGEAKIIKEGSMVVAGGSNPMTQTQYPTHEPSKDTQISESESKPTRRRRYI